MHLTKQEVVDWKNNPVTKEFFSRLQTSKYEILDFIAAGGAMSETSIDATAQNLAGELGKVKALDDILNYAIEDMVDDAVSFEEGEEDEG